jgi:hypothetical protein
LTIKKSGKPLFAAFPDPFTLYCLFGSVENPANAAVKNQAIPPVLYVLCLNVNIPKNNKSIGDRANIQFTAVNGIPILFSLSPPFLKLYQTGRRERNTLFILVFSEACNKMFPVMRNFRYNKPKDMVHYVRRML